MIAPHQSTPVLKTRMGVTYADINAAGLSNASLPGCNRSDGSSFAGSTTPPASSDLSSSPASRCSSCNCEIVLMAAMRPPCRMKMRHPQAVGAFRPSGQPRTGLRRDSCGISKAGSIKTITSAALDGAYEQGENGPQIGVPQLALVLLYIVQLHCTKHLYLSMTTDCI